MKLPQDILRGRGKLGMLLMECLVYLFVFAILLGGATTAFYFCWNHSEALIYATDDITSALHAGERWRADVRAATGKITVETTVTGEVVRIPQARRLFPTASRPVKSVARLPRRAIRNCCWRKSKHRK